MNDASNEKIREEKLLELEAIITRVLVAFRWKEMKMVGSFCERQYLPIGFVPRNFFQTDWVMPISFIPMICRVSAKIAKYPERVDEFSHQYRIVDGKGVVRWLEIEP
jgi:hypothetical protein